MVNTGLSVLMFVLTNAKIMTNAKSLSSCDLDTSYKYMSSRTSYDLIGNASNFYEYEMPSMFTLKLKLYLQIILVRTDFSGLLALKNRDFSPAFKI
jgi:hypothetical protein